MTDGLNVRKLAKELVENYVEHAIIMAVGNWALFMVRVICSTSFCMHLKLLFMRIRIGYIYTKDDLYLWIKNMHIIFAPHIFSSQCF